MAGLFGTRIQLPELSQAALRPAANISSSTFERAPDASAAKASAKDLEELVRALGTLNESVNRYANVRESVRQDPQAQENKDWIAKRSQMSFEQLRSEAEKGSPDGIRVREDAVYSLLGDKAYSQFRNDWATYYNTEFDRQNGDLTAEYEKRRQEFAANLPDDISRGRFYNLTEKNLENWQEVNTKERVENATEQVQTAVLDNFRNTISDGKDAGLSPQEIAKKVFEASAGNRSFLKFSGQQQNETLFQVATEAAQNGDLELVRALVDTPRIGSNGEKIPPLKNIASYASKALSLIDKAQNSKLNKNNEENTKAYIELAAKVTDGSLTDEDAINAQKSGYWTSQQAASYLQQSKNNLVRIQDKENKEKAKFDALDKHNRAENAIYVETLNSLNNVSGATYVGDAEIPNKAGTGTEKISRQQRIERAVELKEAQFNDQTQQLIDAGQSPEEAKKNVDKLRLAWYSNNNIENKTWTDMFNGVASRMTPETLTKNPEMSKVLTQQLETYHNLKENNPAYLERFVTDKNSKEFLEYFDNAVTYGQLPTHDAALAAANWVSKGAIEKQQSLISAPTADKITRSILGSLSLDKDTSYNYSMTRRMVETQSRLGVPESRLKEVVLNQLEKNSVNINGVMVKKTKDLPPDFAPLMFRSLDDLSKRLPEARGEIPSSDMIVIPTPNEGMWSVHQKSNPTRVLGIITPQHLENIRQEDIQERNAITKEKLDLQKEEADYVKLQLPRLEARREKYVAGERAKIQQMRSLSKQEGDYYDEQAKSLEENLNKWIINDNAATARAHKIAKFATGGVETLGKYVSAGEGLTELPESKATKAKRLKDKNIKKADGIVGLYGQNN